MPVTNPLLIHVGRGDIYINVPIPTVPPVALSAADGSPLTGGVGVGSTMGPSSLIFKPNPHEIRSQQSTSVVGYVTITDDASIEFELGEMSYTNMVNTVPGRLDQVSFISFGGLIVPQIQSVLIVAPRRAGGYISCMLYQCAMYGDRNWTFNREGHLALKVIARAQGVTTRALGDQLGYFHPNTNNN